MRWVVLLCAGLLAPTATAGPLFKEVAADLGIDHRYTGGWEHFVGGGVAVFDCDGDLLPEVFAAGGSAPATLLRNRSGDGSIVFEQNTPPELAIAGVTGAYPVDIDSDGRLDLVLLRVGENKLLRGLPDCRFEPLDIGFASGDHWTTAFSATWEGGNTLPTLAFGNYVDRADPNGPFEACDANHLYRPDAAQYVRPDVLTPGYCALSILFSDWNRNGRADLRISNDRHYYVRGGSEQLWAMEATPRLYDRDDGWKDTSIWGMGIASRDISGDGLPEIALTSMGDQKLHSLSNGGETPTYEDAPFDRGVSAHRPYTGGDGRPSTGWHAAFGDIDNDGLDDLFIAKGNVEAMPGSAMDDPNNLLMQGADGIFVEHGDTASIASVARGRGAALADLDHDGLLDLVVVNRNAPLEIYQNRSPGPGNWLLLLPNQPAPNRHAVGTWIEVRAGGRVQSREITIGGGHASGWAGFQHFGLGPAAHAQVRLIWPDGETTDWQTIRANKRYRLRRIAEDRLSLDEIP